MNILIFIAIYLIVYAPSNEEHWQFKQSIKYETLPSDGYFSLLGESLSEEIPYELKKQIHYIRISHEQDSEIIIAMSGAEEDCLEFIGLVQNLIDEHQNMTSNALVGAPQCAARSLEYLGVILEND